jgi:glycosyltransferase involved in cell wall biosynthesis
MVVHKGYPLGEPRVRRQAESAARQGWSVTVLCLRDGNEPLREEVDGVQVRRVPIGHRRDMTIVGLLREYGLFWVAVLAFCCTCVRYDSVVVANPPDFLVFATLPLRFRGARILLDVHDLMTDLFESRMGTSTNTWRSRLLSLLERLSMRTSDLVLTVHEPYAEEIRVRTRNTVDVRIVMNSADERFFKPRSSDAVEPPVIAYHGSVLERYGVVDLLNAFSIVHGRIPEATLAVLGDGDALDQVRAEVRRLNLQDSVVLPGKMLPVEAIVEFLQTAHLGVIPNRPDDAMNRFALSTKLFEYVATGVPVVAAKLPTIAAHFSEEELAFFAPGQVSEMAERIAETLKNPAMADERARRALARYEAQYSWQRQRAVFLSSLQ